MNLRPAVIASAASTSGDAIILRSEPSRQRLRCPVRASRRMAARGPWYETAFARLLTMRIALQLALTAIGTAPD